MKLNLISRGTIKSYLGIVDSSSDSNIDKYIPIVSADVRKILNTKYDTYVSATYTTSAAELIFPDYRRYQSKDGYYFADALYWVGQVVQGVGIPDDTYVTEYDPLTDIFTISNTPTSSGVYVYPTINIAQWPTISKMAWYRIQKETTSGVTAESVKSEAYGPVSKTYTDAEINKQWNYPQLLIDDLGVPFQGIK